MTQYKVNGRNFTSPKQQYSPGEEVTMVYGRRYIGTDTSYYFSSEDVEFSQDFDQGIGYVIKFIMPEHDVEIKVTTKNTMTFDPDAYRNAVSILEMRNRVKAGEQDPTGRFWTCPDCGSVNYGMFCPECGCKKPE